MKIIRTLDTDVEQFSIEDLIMTDILYYNILVSPKTLDMLYKNQFEFPKNQAEFTQNIYLFTKDAISNDTCMHLIYLAQQLYKFKMVSFGGPNLNLEFVFKGIMFLLMPEFDQKFMFEYERSATDSAIFDESLDFPSIYIYYIKQYDDTDIQLPKIKL